MQGEMTYRKARKLNAIFLLLLLATESAGNRESSSESQQNNDQGRGRSPEYFEEKLREYEREQFRF